MTHLFVDENYFFLITLIRIYMYFSGINWLYLAITALHLITQFIKVACQVKFHSVQVAKYDQWMLQAHAHYKILSAVAIYSLLQNKQIKFTLTLTGVFFVLRVSFSAVFSTFLYRNFVQFSDCPPHRTVMKFEKNNKE